MHKDRHENFGFGTLGFDTLINIIYHDKLKNIPKFCGVFCNSNAFGLGQVTQIFRYPSDCHKKRINIIKRFKALLIRN